MEAKALLVAIPLFNGMTFTDAIGPYEVLGCIPNARIMFVAQNAGTSVSPGSGHTNLKLVAEASFDEVPFPDVLVIPGGPVANLPLCDEYLLDWIRKAHKTSMYTTSVCTGSLLLGAAGILDQGMEATTHWLAYEELASYGAIVSKERYIQQGKVVTAAGVSSGIDMALYLVSLLEDEKTAQAIQLLMEYDPLPPFDTGSMNKASPSVLARVGQILTDLHTENV